MASLLLAAITAAMAAAALLYFCWKVVSAFWISPLRAHSQLRRNGFAGPTPTFPLGNIQEMRKLVLTSQTTSSSDIISHDIHSAVFPYFAQWHNSHGKVFVYWLGTEPFLYIADPEFLKAMSAGIMGKSWGKPRVFKQDREPMFGNGLVMVEGEEWVRHRHVITPAFTAPNLKPAPNVQRQAKEDIRVGDRTIPKGTNMWIDVVAMHHDPKLWGDDAYEFKPERFEADPLYGGCKHKMGFMPFGFGGRMCVGRNLTMMEYQIVLSMILTRFSFSLSPSYVHSPTIVLSLRPTHGIPLVLRPLQS
ncbi:unnamed protein product [Linum trigynum]|uniref:Uncharacterized protein n=1 Tax=Linum trigynum TaxID=586398 RepID=A0AAV2DDE3_9ROSI